MRVTHVVSVRVHQTSARLVRPFVTAIRRADTVTPVLVELRDSEGRSGWGEAPTSWRVTGESFASVREVVEEAMTPEVVGMPTDDPEAISRAITRAAAGNNAARMAVDCAAYDLAAQRAGVSVWRYLGARHGEVTTDMTLSATDDTGELLEAAREHRAAGFTTLKVKVAAQTNTAEQLTALRAAVGAGVRLRVDANQAWDVEEAVQAIDGLAPLDLEFVEQPTARDDIGGLVEVAGRVSVPVMADESVWTRRQLLELLGAGGGGSAGNGVRYVNIKLAKTGGLREALALAALARERGIGIVVGCMLESHVGIAAAASLAAAISDNGIAAAHDLDGGLWMAESPVVGGAHYDGPRIALPDAPGFGVTGLA